MTSAWTIHLPHRQRGSVTLACSAHLPHLQRGSVPLVCSTHPPRNASKILACILHPPPHHRRCRCSKAISGCETPSRRKFKTITVCLYLSRQSLNALASINQHGPKSLLAARQKGAVSFTLLIVICNLFWSMQLGYGGSGHHPLEARKASRVQ